MLKVQTLCFIREGDNVLLGMKKRGFGEGRWNGFGGKLEGNETIEEAARREILEEVSLSVKDLEYKGQIDFTFEGKPDGFAVHIFFAKDCTGIPIETEEMRPQWFLQNNLPFDKMWVDDPHWLPQVLQGLSVKGHIHFLDQNKILTKNLEFK
jgi:8-oxo-dGTP pyrophosphatase MutT (NUDIX family)